KLFYGLLVLGQRRCTRARDRGRGQPICVVKLMNAKARALGLRDSHFRSPSGVIDRDNYSSAWDMAALARYAMSKPRFRAIVRTPVKRVPWAAPTFSK